MRVGPSVAGLALCLFSACHADLTWVGAWVEAKPTQDSPVDPNRDSAVEPDRSLAVELQPDLPYASGALTSAVLSDGLHLLGGSAAYDGAMQFADHYVYEATTKTWSSSRADIPDTNTWNAQAHAYRDKIYLAGGWPAGDNLFRAYNLATDSWESLAPIPGAFSYGFASAVAGDFFYIFGGKDGPAASAPVYKYDLVAGAWSACANIPQNANEGSFAAAAWGTKIYILNGDMAGGSTILQIYDAVSDSWSTGPNLGAHHEMAAAVALAGKVYFFGGLEHADGFDPASGVDAAFTLPLRDAVNVYDVATETWSVGGTLTVPRAFSTAQVVGDAIHVLGGFDGSQLGLPTHEIFFPQGIPPKK